MSQDTNSAVLRSYIEGLGNLIGGMHAETGNDYRLAKHAIERALILVAELEHENAELREIAQAVAKMTSPVNDGFLMEDALGLLRCPFCDASYWDGEAPEQHNDGCIWPKVKKYRPTA